MNEEKLYAVKNDEGKYWDFSCNAGWWSSEISDPTATIRKYQAEKAADENGGHVVTLVEEPKKVVLTKEQAKIVEGAHEYVWPATYISDHIVNSLLENQMMDAYVNGYTVEKEKKYMVELDGLVTTDGVKQYLTKKDGKWFACRKTLVMYQSFTDKELNEAPEWAQQLNREEVTAEIERYGLQECEKAEVDQDAE